MNYCFLQQFERKSHVAAWIVGNFLAPNFCGKAAPMKWLCMAATFSRDEQFGNVTILNRFVVF